MKRIASWACLGAVVLIAACVPPDEGGGGGGGGTVTFTQGFVFTREDGNVYVADKADYTQVGQLTTNGANKHPSLSADGKQVVFVHTDASGNTSLQAVAANGGSVRTILPADASTKGFRNPVFSPDGATIVFVFDTGSGSNSQLGKVASDGTGSATALTPSTAAFASPSFYPDGVNVLAASGTTSTSLTQLHKVNINTQNDQVLFNSLDPRVTTISNRVVISPTGSKAAFDGRLASNSAASRVFVQDLASGATNQLTDYPGDESAVDSFPTWVATSVGFSSNLGGSDQVYVLPSTSVEQSGGLTLPSALQPWYGP